MGKKLLSAVLLLALCATLTVPVLAVEDGSPSLSREGLSFIAQYETFEPAVYQSGEKWRIGYGTPCERDAYPDGIDEEEARVLLEEAAAPSVEALNGFLTQNRLTLTQQEFDAMVSFTYSLGSSWTGSSYRISKYLIAGVSSVDPVEIVDAMAVWCHVKSEVDEEQLQRRIDEARLLLHGDYGDGDAPAYCALILDAAGGRPANDNDTVCYLAGAAYGTLPTATRAGYRLDGWKLENGQALAATDTVSKTQRVSASWAPAGSLTFKDVKEGDWFFKYVYDLSRDGIINGYSPDEFAPQDNVTLSQSLKLILLAAGHKAQSPSGSHWASGYLDYAIAQSLLPSGAHELDRSSARLAIATLAAKALELPASTTKTPFTDCDDAAVLSLYDAGIIEGSYEGSDLVFLPDSNITRAEISAIVWRMAAYYEKDNPKPADPPEPDRSNQILFRNQWIDILPNVPKSSYKAGNFTTVNGRKFYNSSEYSSKTGVDVSVYQNNIDWNKVKADGIDFAFIRVGGRGWGSEGKIYDDRTFKQNIEGALAAGLDVGVYFFSQAITVQEAREEARHTLNAIKGYDITYPVVFDWERIGGSDARTYNLATNTLCAAANAFCSEVEAAGYEGMIYFNLDCGYLKFDLSKILDYRFWLAQYEVSTPTFYYHYDIWQYSDAGSVSGIPGRVDMNLEFIKK